jgi:hypothetical protein
VLFIKPNVVKVVSRWTKIPITTLDQEEDNLINLVDKLHERVVGQDEAVNLVAQEVLRSRVGFCQSDQPIGSFLFLGPAGVGKTELAKALAEKLFDNEKTLVRFDMSEYADSGSVSRLIGGSRRFGLYTFCTFIPFQHFLRLRGCIYTASFYVCNFILFTQVYGSACLVDQVNCFVRELPA